VTLFVVTLFVVTLCVVTLFVVTRYTFHTLSATLPSTPSQQHYLPQPLSNTTLRTPSAMRTRRTPPQQHRSPSATPQPLGNALHTLLEHTRSNA